MFQEFNGVEALAIDIANNFGGNGAVELDKQNWDDRLAWFKANENQLDKLVSSAKEPALFYAGVQAMKKVKAGQPIGYPVSFDATSSGLQILAAITCDRKAALLCNVLNTGNREDAYINLFHIMKNNMMKLDAGAAGNLKRGDLKDAIMTALYGSEAVPKQVFGEGQQLRCFFNTMSEEAPIAWALNEAFLSMWDADATEYNWVLPDNFHVKTKVMDTESETVHFNNNKYEIFTAVNRAKKKGRSLGANTIHSLDGMIVREIARRCDYDPKRIAEIEGMLNQFKKDGYNPNPFSDPTLQEKEDYQMVKILWARYAETGYLSARILDHLGLGNLHLVDIGEIEILIASLPKKPFKVISVHDCFRVLPHYVTDLRRQYNLQLALLAKSEILTSLIRQITGKTTFVAPKDDPNMWTEILDANYALS